MANAHAVPAPRAGGPKFGAEGQQRQQRQAEQQRRDQDGHDS
jgi:hypothetical protein